MSSSHTSDAVKNAAVPAVSNGSQGLTDHDKKLLGRLLEEANDPHFSRASLPADWLALLHMFDWMSDQRKLLEEMFDYYRLAVAQMDDIKKDMLNQQDLEVLQGNLYSMLQHTDRKIDDLHGISLFKAPKVVENDTLWPKHVQPEVESKDCHDQQDAKLEMKLKESQRVSHQFQAAFTMSTQESTPNMADECQDALIKGEIEEGLEVDLDNDAGHHHYHWDRAVTALVARRNEKAVHASSCHLLVATIVESVLFEMLSAVVIMTNAIVMGVTAADNIDYALQHIGEGEPERESWKATMSICFFSFYSVEICLRVFAERWKFFTDEKNMKWNLFDLLLVISGSYDIAMELLHIKPINVTWVRLLRLVKMVKMLRVVRVMKIFKQMRTILQTMSDAFVTLIWSILVLIIIMYIFGLIFLFSVAGYLSDTHPDKLDSETLDNITAYWSSVPTVIVSLFMALTGGTDWEIIAQPIKVGGVLYYGAFLFYIAFGLVSVMNVLTGLIVDNAAKASREDDDEVVTEIFEKHKDKIKAMARLFKDDPEFKAHRTISWEAIEANMEDPKGIVCNFLGAFDITGTEAKRIFFMLVGKDKRAFLDSFITGCSKARGAQLGVEIFSLSADTRVIMRQLNNLMSILEVQLNVDKDSLCYGDGPMASISGSVYE